MDGKKNSVNDPSIKKYYLCFLLFFCCVT